MKTQRVLTIANLLTTLRIILLPFLLLAESHEKNGLSFAFLIIIGLSDFFDGLSARRWNNASSVGAVYDIAVDFTVIYALLILFYLKHTFPLLLLMLTLLSMLSFSATCVQSKEICKHALGQYTGTVLFSGMLIFYFTRVFLEDYSSLVLRVIISIMSLYLVLSIVENTVLIIKGLNKRS